MADNKQKLVIIDSHALLHRAWHAVPPLQTKDGLMVNAVYGFTSLILNIIKELKPQYVLAAWDLPEPTWRHKDFVAYKAQRVKKEDEFYQQIPLAEEVMGALSIPVLSAVGWEADDIIGTVSKIVHEEYPQMEILIVTGDLDALQLVNGKVKVITLKRGFNDTVVYDEAAVKERYGLKPAQLIDLKAIQGDTSDNIPGVKGIGEKGASDLIKNFGNLEKVYQNLESSKIKARLKELLQAQKSEAFLSKKLVTISTAVPIKLDLGKAQWGQYRLEEVYNIFQKFEFNSLLKKLPAPENNQLNFTVPAKKETGNNYQLIDDEQAFASFYNELAKQEIFAFDTETEGLDVINDQILGCSFSWQENKGWYLNLANQKLAKLALEKLKPILENSKIKKVGHNIKFDYKVLKVLGITLKGIYFDTLIAAYLINPSRGLRLEELAFTYFGYKKLKLTDLIADLPKKKKEIVVAKIPLDKLSYYAAEDADITWRLYQKLLPVIKEKQNFDLLQNMEIPLIPVLGEMELTGVALDVKLLKDMAKEFNREINKVSQKIYKLAGEEFNISSPQQLKEILFVKLKIAAGKIKKTKTGLSTAASELDKMMEAHPIIPLISEYRELTKLQSTYIKALPEMINPSTGRIHTSFNQTIAATGRLSSSDPNLQNIPVRTALGRRIRQAFIAPKNKLLLSADYSQIELRLAAAISHDPKMIKSFKEGEDIHARTAAEIHKINLAEVTKEIRRTAKEVNFGVLYGLGSLGLAQRTGLKRDEAKEFINKYFSVYKNIKQYIDNTKVLAEKQGYVKTLFGRRRYLPDIHSTLPMLKAAAERMAVNMPLQGTAADLMKLAMIKIQAGLPKISPEAKMVLQVHDELVLEVPKDDLKPVAKFVKTTMENIYTLKVPLVADVEAGPNWNKLEKI